MTEAGAQAEYASLKSGTRLAYNVSNLLFLLTGFMAMGMASVIKKQGTRKFLKSITIPLAYLAITIMGLIVTYFMSGISIVGRYYLLYAIMIVVLAAMANLVITINKNRKSPDIKSKT